MHVAAMDSATTAQGWHDPATRKMSHMTVQIASYKMCTELLRQNLGTDMQNLDPQSHLLDWSFCH